MARGRCGTRARSAVALSGFSHQCVDITFFFSFLCVIVCVHAPVSQSQSVSGLPNLPASLSQSVKPACLPTSQPCATHQPASQSIGQRIIPCLSVRLDIMREKARKTAEKSGESRTKTRYCYPPEKIGISVKNMEICNT